MRIYQILSQWIYKGEVEYSIEELRFMLDVKEVEYSRYNDFKRKVLEVALKEINKSSSLKYTYKEIKTGRKVTSIAFIIISAKEPVKDLMQEVFSAEEVKLPSIKVEKLAKINFVVMENQKESEVFKRLTKLGLSKSNSQKLLDQYQEDYILFALSTRPKSFQV